MALFARLGKDLGWSQQPGRTSRPAGRAASGGVCCRRDAGAAHPQWDKAIGAAIDASDYFVIAVSANAVALTHVGEEIHYAFSREREKRPGWIMPVLLDTTNPSQIYWQLGRRQYRDLTSADGIADFEAALAAIAAAARESAVPGDGGT